MIIIFRKRLKIALAVMFPWALAARAFMAHRAEQLSKLERLIGEWNVSAKLLAPAELATEIKGTAKFSWALDKKMIRVEGELGPNAQRVRGLGLLTFDDSGSEEAHRYRATFGWDADVRMVALDGKLTGDVLSMSGVPLASDGTKDVVFDAKVRLGADTIRIDVDVRAEPQPAKFMSILLTRKPLPQR